MKKALLGTVLIGIILFAFILMANGGREVFTKEELAKYNGKNGNAAYVAIDGVVYDVSNVPAWKGGTHKGNQAGQDVTAIIKNKSPHGLKVLGKLIQVGYLTDKIFSAEELAKYNGKNGNAAYVAIDNVVYDVTNVPAWKDGAHNGISAGQDVTDILKSKSPHGTKPLSKLKIVGKYTKNQELKK